MAHVHLKQLGLCGEICSGDIDPQCPMGEFCERGQCDHEYGLCQEQPAVCDRTCDPVCACDGQEYINACVPWAAGVSVNYFGTCPEGVGPLVHAVRFDSPTEMGWSVTPNALSYNVYRNIVDSVAPEDMGVCYLPGLSSASGTVVDTPPSGVLWLLQITATFTNGEGPMGLDSVCKRRAPLDPC